MQETEVVVFDAGSQNFKVGFSGDSFPKIVFPTVVGRFRQNLIDGVPDLYCSFEAVKKRGVSVLNWPVVNGLFNNWDDMEKLWHHAFFREIFTPPDESKVMHCINPLTSLKDKETLLEILFETFNIRSLFVMTSPVLQLHASGRTSGLSWESGAGLSIIVPIYEGYPIYHAIKTSELTGDTMTKILQKQLMTRGCSFTTPSQIDIIEDIKKTICYVARDVSCYGNKAKLSYTLPDGNQVDIGEEKFMCAETFFDPSINNMNCNNIVDAIISSIDKSGLDIQSQFYENIVIGGGNTMYTGLQTRLYTELSNKMHGYNINVIADKCRENAAWLGASIIASMPSMKECFMTNSEYDEHGAEIVHQRLL